MRAYSRLAVLISAPALFLVLGCAGAIVPEPSNEWRLQVGSETRTIDRDPRVEGNDRVPLYLEALPTPDEGLGFARSPVVDESGRLFVLESETRTIRAFSPTGEVLWTVGDSGGDTRRLVAPAVLLLFGDRLGVIDATMDRLSLWTLDGEHDEDVISPLFLNVNAAEALDAQRMVARLALQEQLSRQEILSILSIEGEEVSRLAFLPSRHHGAGDLFPRPAFAVAKERIFVTTGDAYQLFAYDFSGAQLWALRVPWPRAVVTDEALGRSLERTRRAGRAMRENVGGDRGIEMPSHFPALATITTDGLGRIYAFPFVEEAEATETFPVDVYDADGQLLVHGTLPFQDWDTSRGDEVYRLERDPVNQTSTITRYRISLPGIDD